MAEERGGKGGHESHEYGGLSRRDRSMLGKLAGFLGFADLMAFLMVAATAFSGYATWRTAGIAQALYRASERPYVGVQRVWMDHARPNDIRVSVEYRNYGHVPAADTTISERLMVDGKLLPAVETVLAAGIISPSVPHFVHVHLKGPLYDAVSGGHSSLVAMVTASYSSAGGHKLCYMERFKYSAETDSFDANGGSPRCRDQRQFELHSQ